jgi:hypothetical protein
MAATINIVKWNVLDTGFTSLLEHPSAGKECLTMVWLPA